MTEDQKIKARIRSNRWVAKNRDKARANSLAYYHRNKERFSAVRAANKEKIAARGRAYYQKNKEKIKKVGALYFKRNKARIAIRSRDYYIKNKARCMATINARRKVRAANDPTYRISIRMRSAVNRLIKCGWVKDCRSSELIGCGWRQVREHLEAKFTPGMSWETYGIHGWHIDHIRPLASFDLTKTEECKAAFHYTNLQPLWAKDNLAKKDKYTPMPSPPSP